MPFEALAPMPSKRIAVIGGGISGMSAAYMLADEAQVVLFEAQKRLGGHARTIVAGKNGDQPVDTGFIVFNYANYPHITALFNKLNVPVVKSNMSFGASLRGGGLEYGLANLSAVFAQKRNVANPRFLRMLNDIFRFNSKALAVSAQHPTATIGEFIRIMGLSDWFRDYYLLPLSGAIWSTPVEKIMDFPAHAMMQFFENHALLHHTGQHQWYTVQSGSVEYVHRLKLAMLDKGVELRLGTGVQAVRRVPGGVEIKTWGHEPEVFDEVVFGTHSDDSLRLLADPSEQERAALGAIAYQPNDIVLHADETIMPRRKAVWSSWNYAEAADKSSDRIDLTYWMNKLQPIPKSDPMFVTLNTTRPIKEELIYDQVTLRHPVYDLAALEAQKQVAAFNGTNNTWFCGAWMRHGFHEDGIHSAVQVVEKRRAGQLAVAAQ